MICEFEAIYLQTHIAAVVDRVSNFSCKLFAGVGFVIVMSNFIFKPFGDLVPMIKI